MLILNSVCNVSSSKCRPALLTRRRKRGVCRQVFVSRRRSSHPVTWLATEVRIDRFSLRVMQPWNSLPLTADVFSKPFLPRGALLARIGCRRVSVCPSFCLSVSHKSVSYPKDRTNQAAFWHGGFLPPIPDCVIRKFG